MIAHSEYQRLLGRTCACRDLGQRWSGYVYRCPKLKYTGKANLLSGNGSLRYGGRWNAAGFFPAVYVSLTPQTALEESLGGLGSYGIPRQHTKFPRSMVAMRVRLHDVLDLTDGSIRKHLFVSRNRMVDEDWLTLQDAGHEALTQAIGRAAYKVGFEAMLVPSKADLAGTNLVLFPGNLHAESHVICENEDELPD